MTKYRKKPVVIDAWPNASDAPPMPDWLELAAMNGKVWRDLSGGDAIIIATLEGQMTASLGDWIIQGVKGEIYPCKPDIFAATYELAEV